MELDTAAQCGGSLDDLHLWMLDGVDIRTDWTEQRAVENRGAHAVLAQIEAVEKRLPFTLPGIDSDNGGEFINHHLARYAQAGRLRFASRERALTRATTMPMSNKETTRMCGSISVRSVTITQRLFH